MTRLTDEYEIEEDSRYAQCNREAALSFALFVLAAVATLITTYVLTAGRSADEYGAVLGLPSYLFWGVVVTDVAFLLAVALSVRTVFREISLDPPDPSSPLMERHHVR